MKKNLAFFGAFNPPTVAHLDLAKFALDQTSGEQVVFVPSKAVYIREEQGKDFAYTDQQRLAMLNAAAAMRPWMRVSDWETRQENQPRTYVNQSDCSFTAHEDRVYRHGRTMYHEGNRPG